MKYPWAVVGAKVVCVDAKWGEPAHHAPLTEGAMYEVRNVFEALGKVGVRLVGVVNVPSFPGGPELGYEADRFRPLHDTSKQIEEMKCLMLDAATRRKVSA